MSKFRMCFQKGSTVATYSDKKPVKAELFKIGEHITVRDKEYVVVALYCDSYERVLLETVESYNQRKKGTK